MEYICPSCQKAVSYGEKMCEASRDWFSSLKGKGIWRIRFVNRYAFQFLSQQQWQDRLEKGPLILSEACYWENFDPDTLSGVNSQGIRTSIFT